MENPYGGERYIAGMRTAPLPIPVGDDRGGRKVTQTDYAVQPSNHIDQIRKNRSNNGVVGTTGQPTAPIRGRPPKGVQTSEPSSRVPSRGRGSQYMHYIPSNLSTTTFQRPAPPPPSRNHSFVPPPPISDLSPNETVSEQEEEDTPPVDNEEDEMVVKSSIPLGFYRRADPFAEGSTNVDVDVRVVVQELDVLHGKGGAPDEVVVKISWHGEGQSVILALESDNTWNGRQQMELEASPKPPIPYPLSPPVSPPATSTPTSPPLDGTPVTNAPVFSTTLSLRTDKQTHHIRFLVDDEWRIADNLPTAVDSTGSLANYLVVGQLPPAAGKGGENGHIVMESRIGLLTRTTSLPPASTSTLGSPNGQAAPPGPGSLPLPNGFHIPHGIRQLGGTNTHGHPAATNLGRVRHQKPELGLGYSFWSASSSNDIEAVEVEVIQRKEQHTGSGNDGRKRRSPPPPMKMPIRKVHYEPQWITEIPLELVEAAQEEERFLEHQAQVRSQMESKSRGQQNRQQTQHVSGFIPLPNIPPAQHLPRHLEKLILNTSSQHGRSSGGGHGHGDKDRDGRKKEKERERAKENRFVPSPVSSNNSSVVPLPVTTASGTDVTSAHCSHRSLHHHLHHHHAKQHGHHSSSERDLNPPNNQPATTAVTAAAISSAGSAKRISTTGAGEETAALIADDSSVLPVPSHVVLHHLSTSAIKNGVLAVSQTGRYRHKYVTTIYYKPT
ncbi:galactose metabolism- protein [Marasmius sp. AFHP31]|nr:galactose metabolism- protein [Marasmius sp. AFHP31]